MDDDLEITGVTPLAALTAAELCVVVLTGRAVGTTLPLRGRLVIGRGADADLTLDDDGVSRAHAVITREGDVAFIADLGSTNGTWVERERVMADPQPLRDGDRIRVGATTLLKVGRQDRVEQQLLAELYRNATRDALTALHNRRWFDEQLVRELAWHRRHNRPLTLLLLDVDHLKRVNDRYGHLAGDTALKQVADAVRTGCRTEDACARFGGDELVVLLRDTDARAGQQVAARLCAQVAAQPFDWRGQPLAITVSVGVVTHTGAELQGADLLIGGADAYLYLAKERGRNQCVPAPAESD